MTPSVRLIEIEIEGFRGFAAAQTLPLDADVVLVSGGNGTGKTSMTDALAWILTGTLPGLAERLKGERKGEDYVVSRYTGGPARVRLMLEVDERRVEVERRGDASGNELHVRPAARNPGQAETELAGIFGFEDSVALATGVHAWGVLRQDAMRSTLEQGSEQLHVRLREILGLGVLADFEGAARDASSALNREAKAARDELDTVGRRLAHAGQQLDVARMSDATREGARSAVQARLERLRAPIEGVQMLLLEPAGQAELARTGSAVGELLELLGDVAQEVGDADAALEVVPEHGTVDKLVARRTASERRVRDLAATHGAQQRLAEAALELLNDHCPVCAQQIKQDELRAELQERLATAPLEAAQLEEARRQLADAQSALERAQSAERRAEAADHRRSSALARWAQAVELSSQVSVPDTWRAAGGLNDARRGLEAAREELQRTYRDLAQVEADPAVASAVAEVETLTRREKALRERAEDLAGRHQRADALQKAATAAAVEITQEGLEALEPAFAEVYDRLAPHPSFTELKMAHDVYYGKGRTAPRVVDPVRGIEANPNLVCSEGQLNVIALSYFLALNLETERGGLPFAVLDDPLQAMDVINVLGFADVARALRRRRQLIVATHDRRFASLLDRKLAPRESGMRTLHLRFSAWDRQGPVVDAVEEPIEQVPALLGRAA